MTAVDLAQARADASAALARANYNGWTTFSEDLYRERQLIRDVPTLAAHIEALAAEIERLQQGNTTFMGRLEPFICESDFEESE